MGRYLPDAVSDQLLNAGKMMIENALSNSRVLDATAAFERGIADTISNQRISCQTPFASAARIITRDQTLRQ